MTTPLRFPESARGDAPEEEYSVAMLNLRAAWHDGMKNGYECLADVAVGFAHVPMVRRARPEAVCAHTFDAWLRATANSGNERRTRDCARASGLMAAWVDHPEAQQCANCDLPVVPGIEDSYRLCPNHGVVCSPTCVAEICSRSCADACEEDR